MVWDLNAQTAIWDIAHQAPPQIAGRGFAMVSGAVYDAVNAIEGTPYEPYLVAPAASGRESAGAAAYRVLDAIFPEQRERLRVQYDDWLAGLPDGPAKRGGIRVGTQAAAAMITARQDDGAFDPRLWTVGAEPGQYRPTPPAFENTGARVGFLKPFAVPDATMFRTPGPPAVTSRAYARDFAEVKWLGSATSTARTADQTEAALWWHDRRSVSLPVRPHLPHGRADDGLPALLRPGPGPVQRVQRRQRHFGSFSQASVEVVGARIWAGIHFRSADVDGTELGAGVGRYITRHYFQPRR